MSKRSLLYVLLIVVILLSACSAPTAAPVQQDPPTNTPAAAAEQPKEEAPAPTTEAATKATDVPEKPTGYTQSPMLDEMVSSGKLPPIEERLPVEPFVVGPGIYMTEENLPDWQPGKFGGTLRTAHSVANWSPDVFVAANEPLLMAPKIGVQGIRGNVVQDFKVENDNKEFTFYMRKGLKWSDGVEVTSEDVRFVYEDIYLNEQLTPVFPARFRNGFRADGEPMKLEIIDDYTFKITFTEPYGGFLRALTIEGWNGYTEIIRPSHVLKKWHTKYTPIEEMSEELEKMNLKDEWWQVFANKNCNNWDLTNPRCAGYPSLYPWIGVATDNPSVLNFERNPYYFKVDTQGQQLPYIDKVVSQQVENVEMVNLKVLTGEVDFLRESTALVKIPLYKENEEKAGFRTVLLDMHVDSSSLQINQTFGDEKWRKVAQDVRFRQALSLAVNRQSIIDTVYYGYASLPLDTVGEEFAKYDPERANALLDEMGLTNKDSEGNRTYPDGSQLEIILEHGAHAPDIAPVADLLITYFKEVGIKLTVKQIDPNLWDQKGAANERQATVMWSHDIGWDGDVVIGNVNRAGRAWENWRITNGAQGEEPPDWIKEAIELESNRWKSVSGSDEYNKLVQDGFEWCRENLPYINFVEHVKYPLIINKDLKNVPSGGYAIAGNFSIVQMYFDR